MGWAVITIWECQLKPTVRRHTLSELEYYINKNYLDRYRLRQSLYLDESEVDKLVAEAQEEYEKNPGDAETNEHIKNMTDNKGRH